MSSLEKENKKVYPNFFGKNVKIWPFSTVHKSLNTHGTLSVYLLCRLLAVSCFQKKTRFGEIVNSGSQSNLKGSVNLKAICISHWYNVIYFTDNIKA